MANFVAPIWQAFNGGELSPLLDGRTDQEKYFTGCKTLRNFIPTVQGPAARRAGTRYLGATKNNGKAWLIPFQFSSQQSYVLEFGDSYLRFWVNRGQLQSAGAPYEISTPYTSALLTNTAEGTCNLRVVQSADIMWIVHADGVLPPYKLQRLGATNWTLTAAPITGGPFPAVDPNNTTTIQASAQTGTITLTASSSIFQSYHVGTLIYLESKDPSIITAWNTNKAFAANSIARYSGNVYSTTAGGTTGTVPPTHLRGTGSDGVVSWLYQHSTWGIVQITGYTSGTQVTGTVVGTLPIEMTAAGYGGSSSTTRYSFQEINSNVGYPTDIAFFRQRLCYIKGRKMFMSFVGDFDNFNAYDGPDMTDETAINITIASDKIDMLRWCAPTNALLTGTSQSELAVMEQSGQQVLSASNIKSSPQTSYGSRRLKPIVVGDAALFVQRSGKRMREIKYDFASDRYQAQDLSVLSPHILNAGVVDMAFALEPDSLVWCVLSDGTLGALTYNRERGVVAWTPHQLGGSTVTTSYGVVEAVAVIPKPDLTCDDVWFIVKRTINGNTVRYVEVLENYNLVTDNGLPYGVFVDAAITYSGAPTSAVTGLSHLEGQTVSVLVDGSPHAPVVVSGGSITLTQAGSYIIIGLQYTSTLQTMRPEPGARDGTGQTRRRSIADVVVRFVNTVGGKVGYNTSHLDAIPTLDPLDPYGTPRKLFSGDKRLVFPSNVDTDGYVYVVQDEPLPMTVAAIIPRMVVGD